MSTIHLVDSYEYASTNCFQHQLMRQMQKINVKTVTLNDLLASSRTMKFDRVACCLKARTVNRNVKELGSALEGRPVIIYDLDPWESFHEGTWCGTYSLAMKHMNVESFAVTTPTWVPFLRERNFPAKLVRVWMLPEYCDSSPSYEARQVELGFVGSVHSYRKAAFDRLASMGHNVEVLFSGNSLGYVRYLETVSRLRCFVHHSTSDLVCDGTIMKFEDILWSKDVEAAARGCFVLRNRGVGSDDYMIDELPSVMIYDDMSEVPKIIASLRGMEATQRQDLIERSVNFIKEHDVWDQTARDLV